MMAIVVCDSIRRDRYPGECEQLNRLSEAQPSDARQGLLMATERAWRKMLVARLLFSGARDGNRTRTVSLGSHCRCPSITCGDADLRPSGGVPVSTRQLP